MKHYQQKISTKKEFDLSYDVSLIGGTPSYDVSLIEGTLTNKAADNGASKEAAVPKQTDTTRPRNIHHTGLLVFAYLFGKRQVYSIICTIYQASIMYIKN